MKKQAFIFGHEILMDDLMMNTAQLAAYLEVTKGALSHFNTGRKKPSPRIEKELRQITNQLNYHVLAPQTFKEETALILAFDQEKTKSLEETATLLNYYISKTKKDLQEMEVTHEHAMRAFNNLQYLLKNIKKLDPSKKPWLLRQAALCERTAHDSRPLMQTKLKMKLAGLKAELKVLNEERTSG
jgi:hypothetical protein